MGISCIWIMVFHNRFQWTGTSILRTLISKGNVGVDIFFFLSGIGLYYSFSKDESVPAFYKRRIIRLIIPYLVFAIPFEIWTAIYYKKGLSLFLRLIFQVQFVKIGVTTTWFIPAILVCYIAYPLIYVLQNKPVVIGEREIDRNSVTVILVAIYFLFLVYFKGAFPGTWKNIEIALTRGAVFIIGCHCGKWVKDGMPIPEGTALASFIWIAVYIFSFRKDVKLPTLWIRLSYIPFSVACVILFIWILNAVETHTGRGRFRFLEYTGQRSLELYMSHIMLRMIYDSYLGFPHFEKTGIIDYSLVLIGAFVLSAAVHPMISAITKRSGTPKAPPAQ